MGKMTLAPVVPTLPAQNIIACYFGSNGVSTTLKDTDNGASLKNAKCVNGDPAVAGDVFGQFASCNGKAFMAQAQKLVDAGMIKPPLPGVGSTGHACYTTVSFEMVDQDPSDNVFTTYLHTTPAGGQTVIAQATQANRAALLQMNPNGVITEQGNPGDEGLVRKFLDPAYGCKPWKVANLADPGQNVGSQGLNEIQSYNFMKMSMAMGATASQFGLIPFNNAMCIPGAGGSAEAKVNAYRAEIGQPPIPAAEVADKGKAYCQNFVDITARQLVADIKLLKGSASPDPAKANTLLNFMGQRYVAAYAALGCEQLLGIKSPLQVTMDAKGVTTAIQVMDMNYANLAKNVANGIVAPPNPKIPPNPTAPVSASGSASASGTASATASASASSSASSSSAASSSAASLIATEIIALPEPTTSYNQFELYVARVGAW
jgi:hypothetical protein